MIMEQSQVELPNKSEVSFTLVYILPESIISIVSY